MAAAADAAPADAPDAWRVSGSMRLRYQAVEGQLRPGFNVRDDLLSLRTTLLGEGRQGPFRLGAEIQDGRAWGADRKTPISTSDVNTLELVQAYAGLEFKTRPFGPVSLQGGRFLLNLGSRRLVASDDLRNTTNSYTGLRADLAPAGVRATLVYTQPRAVLPNSLDALLANRQHPDRGGRALQLWGGVAARPLPIGSATLEASYYHLAESDAEGLPTRDRALDTYGARLVSPPRPGRWDYEVEGFRQTGRISRGLAPNDPRVPVEAALVHAGAGYSWPGPWRPRLSADFDVATGDKGGGRYGRFDILFGTRRTDLSPPNARTNIVTPGLRLEVAPGRRWDGLAVMRGLWLQSARDAFSSTGARDPSGDSGTFAGVQVEARARYWLVQDRLRAELDTVWLRKGRFLLQVPNAQPAGDERYLSLSLTGQF